MFNKMLFVLAFVAVFGFAFALTPVSAQAAERVENARGVIVEIRLDAKTFTLRTEGGPVTFHVTDQTKISKNGRAVRLSDLAVGDFAAVEFLRASMNALRVKAQTPKVEGRITAINLDARTLTITPRNGSPVTLNVTERTKIELNGREVRLSDLRVGDAAEALFDPATMNAKIGRASCRERV